MHKSKTIATMMDLSGSHQSYFSSSNSSNNNNGSTTSLMSVTRKRFFSGEGSSSEQHLPMTNTPISSSPSSGNLRLAPGRSLSSSAAQIRQRGTSPPATPVKRAYSENSSVDGLAKIPYGSATSFLQQAQSSASYSTRSTVYQALLVFVFIGLCIFGRMVQESNMELQHMLLMRDHEIDHHIEHVNSLEKKIQRLRDESLHLQSQVELLEEKPAVGMTELQRKLFHMEHSQNLIHNGIQLGDRRMVRERFGLGPHYYVELKLKFPTTTTTNSNHHHQHDHHHHDHNTVLLETAHLDDMPHSIHMFLEQVSHGLYDGTAFHRNAQHVLQAGPHTNAEAHAKFRRHPSLQSVLFQEYSHEFPHKQYTLGYPGRPGGPDFYINLRDNSALHGPGGQANHYTSEEELQQEADPCFARVVAGVEAIQRLHDSEVDWQDVLVHPVIIQRMRVVSKQEYQQMMMEQQSDSDSSESDSEDEVVEEMIL